ncbi:ATP-dependent zinc protease [Vibrio salilacus]|uniref:ATP-dependent zinc protease family protein n=1 Tax=Vibrio salilacus TaxID=1323749 RepID=UPI000C2A7E92|nr:RimK/LysX family protein [Vibrio salilacus]
MNKTWKVLVPLMLSGGLVACSTTGQQVTEPKQQADEVEQSEKIEQPQDSQVDTPEIIPPTVKPEEPVVKAPKTPTPEVKTTTPVAKKPAQKTADGKLLLGEEEWVYIPGLEQNFRARVDTGATTSSISAVDIVPFERDGKDWVKFKIEHDNIKSKEMALPVKRWVKIRQSNSEGTQDRAVVEAWLQVGDLKEKTDFTLADRSHLTYPLLLGRSFFKDVAVVDVSQKYIQDKHK